MVTETMSREMMVETTAQEILVVYQVSLCDFFDSAMNVDDFLDPAMKVPMNVCEFWVAYQVSLCDFLDPTRKAVFDPA